MFYTGCHRSIDACCPDNFEAWSHTADVWHCLPSQYCRLLPWQFWSLVTHSRCLTLVALAILRLDALTILKLGYSQYCRLLPWQFWSLVTRSRCFTLAFVAWLHRRCLTKVVPAILLLDHRVPFMVPFEKWTQQSNAFFFLFFFSFLVKGAFFGESKTHAFLCLFCFVSLPSFCINQPSLLTPFLLFLCLFLPLWPCKLYSIPYILPTTLRFLTLLFQSYLCLIGPFNYIYRSMKVSFSPDIIPSGWLDQK